MCPTMYWHGDMHWEQKGEKDDMVQKANGLKNERKIKGIE
jgi:hypothetical protein